MFVSVGISLKRPAHPGGFARHEAVDISMDTLTRMGKSYAIAEARGRASQIDVAR